MSSATRISRYLLLRELPGDRAAYLAYDPTLQRRVRLVVLDDGDGERVAAARALARLREPHLVAVHDVGEAGGRSFVAQELVDGQTLAEALADPRCDATRVRALFRDLALALAAAHDAGVTHGAVAAAHAVRVESNGRLRLADFSGCTDDDGITRARVVADLDELRDALARALVGRGRGALARRLGGLARGQPAPPTAAAWADALGDAPERRRRRVFVAALAVSCIGALVFGARAWARAELARCDAATDRVRDVWNGARADEISGVFATTGSPLAPEAAREVQRTLDGWTDAWTAAWQDACGAPDDADGRKDARMTCLQHQRAELDAVTRVLAEADAEVVQRAVVAARSLPEPAECPDATAIGRGRARERADEGAADAVRSQLARVRALQVAGRHADGVPAAADALAAARAVGDDALVAEALVLQGALVGRSGDGARSHDVLIDAIGAAWRSGDDPLATRAWIELAFVLAETMGRPVDADWAAHHARAAAERAGGDAPLWLAVERMEGVVAFRAGRYTDSVAAYRRALARIGPHDGDDPTEALLLFNLGNAHLQLRDFGDARAAYGQAHETFERTLGPLHPQLGHLLNSRCALEYAANELDEALDACNRALRIRVVSSGPDHPDTAGTIDNLGLVHAAAGRLPLALELHLRALRTWEVKLGADHPRVSAALNNLGDAFLRLGRLDEARASFERAYELDRRHRGADDPETVLPLRNVARVMSQQGDHEGALRVHREVLEVYRATYGEQDPRVATSFLYIGECLLALGRADEAGEPLERALAAAIDATDRDIRSSIRVALADRSWRLGRRAEAIQHVEQALRESTTADTKREADAWLRAHRP